MLIASAVNIALGWMWHTGFRVRHQTWSLRRHGALAAAAAVAVIGTGDVLRSHRAADAPTFSPSPLLSPLPAPALTASATPPVTESQPIEIEPAGATVAAAAPAETPVETVPAQAAALPAEQPFGEVPTDTPDAIGAKIAERLGDPDVTASIPIADPVAPLQAKPALTKPMPAKPKPAKAAKAKLESAKPAKAATRAKPKKANEG